MPRPRKSITQHKLNGTYRPDRHGALPRGQPIDPTPPEDLDDDQRAAWGEIVESAREYLLQQDRPAVEIAARLMAQMRADFKAMPNARITALGGLLRRLGLTPAARKSLDPIVADGTATGFERF